LASSWQGSSPVTDANGDQLLIHEFWEHSFFGWIAEQRFMLSTGEEVAQLCDNAFVIVRTGELLTRGTSSGERGCFVRERRSVLATSRADRLSKRETGPAALSDAPNCWLSFPSDGASRDPSRCDAE
jgi:hypothetical protein